MKRYASILLLLCLIFIWSSMFGSNGIKLEREIAHSLRMARYELNRGNLDEALPYLEICLELDPNNAEAHLLLAKIITKFSKLKQRNIQTKQLEVFGAKETVTEPLVEELPAVQTAKSGGERAEILWEDFEGGWGPWGDNPPTGWTIIDNGDESPATWNENDWYNYYYDATQQQVARVYWLPSENSEEWLITPTLNIPAATCSLKFWHYYYDYSTTDSAWVLGSINDGSTWPETLALYTTDILGADEAIDLSSWAMGQSQVKIGFEYIGSSDWYWMVDECSVATYVTYTYDVGVTAILNPPDSVPQARRPWPPRAVIRNYGTSNVRRFWVYCTFGSNNVYSDSLWIDAWLNAGASDTLVFPNWDPQNMGTDTMVVCHDGNFDGDLDEDNSNDTLSNEVKVVRAYFTGGPDTYGYSWIDSDTTGGPSYSWVGSSGATTVTLSDDSNIRVEIPFPFRFYENTYDSCYIVSNGYVSFANNTSYTNTTLPSSGAPNNSIYAFWDDLNPGAGGTVWYKETGGSPNCFVVCWDDVPRLGTTNGGSFQILMYDNGAIVIQYADVNFGNASYNYGRSATSGIENSTGTVGLCYLFDWDPYGNLLLPDRAIDFPCNDVPSAPTIYPLFIDLDGNFPVYWTPSIDRDGIAGYQLDEVAPDTLLYDQADANGVFNLSGFTRSNTRSHSPTRSYGSSNVSDARDTMISVDSFPGAESVEFWWWGGIESTIDDGYFDISIDNQASWINMGQYNYNDSTWYYENVDVSAYSGYDIYLRFRYESDGSVNYGGFWVDDILVNGWQWVQTFSTSIGDTTYNITGASNGWHYYRVRGEDNVSNWGYWSPIEDIWVGPNDAPAITVLTPANDTILAGTTYRIEWTDADPDNNATISLYYDTDNVGTDGTLITSGIQEDDAQDFYDWNVGALSGRYYIYGIIDDGVNSPVFDYSPATLTIGGLLKVCTDWIAMYISNDATGAGDAGTYTAATEPAHPYGADITLLYGGGAHNPWSTYNTVRSHQTNTDYVTRDIGATTEVGYSVAQLAGYYSAVGYSGPEFITQEWDVVNGQDDFLVKQEIAGEGGGTNSRLRVTWKVINRANATRTFSIRYEWDTHVNTWDSPAVRKYHSATPDPWQITETAWFDAGIPLSLEETDDTLFATPIVHFLSCTEPSTAPIPPVAPDSLYYVGWAGPAYPYAFQVPYAPPDVLPFALDDAVCFMWLNRAIPQDDSFSVTQYLLVSNPALNIELTEFVASYMQNANKIKLRWVTASEEDNLGFNIYRAIDSDNYEQINDELIPGAGNSSTPQQYDFIDADITRIGLYSYKLEQVDRNGVKQMHGPATIDIRNFIPRVSALHDIRPNPLARGNAFISFAVGLNDEGEGVSLRIFDVSGRMVKTLLDGKRDPGFYVERWDTRNAQSKPLSSGVYYAVLQAGSTRSVQKIVIVK